MISKAFALSGRLFLAYTKTQGECPGLFAFGFAFVRHDSAISEQVRMALAAPSVGLTGRY